MSIGIRRSVYFRNKQLKRAQKDAKKKERSVNWVIAKALKEYLDREESEDNGS